MHCAQGDHGPQGSHACCVIYRTKKRRRRAGSRQVSDDMACALEGNARWSGAREGIVSTSFTMSAALRRIGGDRAVAALQRLAAEVTVLPACHDQVASTEAAKESFGISEASPRWNGAWYSSNRQGWRMGTGNWAACRHASSASGEPARPPGAEESPDQEVPRSGDPSSVPVSGVLRHLPSSWLPYAQLSRLDKPIGTWLLAWPCFWSIALAAPPGSLPDARVMALFGAGAVLLRGAGCTVNDMWDRDLDRQVERTRHRPLAAGTLSLGQATGAVDWDLCS